MRHAQSIETLVFQYSYAAFLGIGKRTGTENAVVMVDASATKQGLFSVDKKPGFSAPFKSAYAEFFCQFFAASRNLAGIEVRRFRRPQVRSANLKPTFLTACGKAAIGIENLYFRAVVGIDLDNGGGDSDGFFF